MGVSPAPPVVDAVLAIRAREQIVKTYPIATAFDLLAAALEEARGDRKEAERVFLRSIQRLIRAR